MNFEEYIKKPFEDQEFEFKEAYWQSAEKLIDHHYNRIRWIRSGILGGVLIAILIASYLFLKTEETSILSKALAHEQILNQNNSEQNNSISSPQSPPSKENNTQFNSASINPESIHVDSETEKSGTNTKSAHSKVAGSTSNNTENAAFKEDLKSVKAAKINFSNLSKLKLKTTKNQSNVFDASGKNSSNAAISSESMLANNKPSVELDAQAIEEKEPLRIQTETELSKPLHSNTETSVVSSMIASESTATLDLPFSNIEGSNRLALLNFPLHLNFGSRRSIIALPRASLMYASAEMLMYPSGNSEAFKFLGFNAGVGYQQPLGKMAFLDLGVSGSFRRGNFAPSIVSTQLNYDFGPRSDAYVLRPEALFSLQVPVLLGIESGKHMVSAGVKLGFLIGVRGTSEYANYTHAFESPTGQASYAYDVVDEGWIESSGFRKFALAYALKYQYRLNSRFIISASLQYLPSDWIENDFGKIYDFTSNEYQNPTGNPAQLIERNWLLGVELRYVLFSKY